MKIIPEALPLAKLQRTNMSEEQIINSYRKDWLDVSENITKPNKILDIGCGICGWICQGIFGENDKDFKIYLIDKTKVDEKVYYGYEKEGSFYNSMEIAFQNLMKNGIESKNIFMQEATEDNKIFFKEKFDLIVSFISCGFHYPVETYLDQIYEKLNEGGVLIIDIRKETNGIPKINDVFGNYEIIREENKYLRIKAVKEEKEEDTFIEEMERSGFEGEQ